MNPNEQPETVRCGDVLAAVQICPFGEWPNGGGLQLCDEAAFRGLVADWRAGGGREVICDFEHRYEDPSPTSDTAAAWITNLAVDEVRGLVGDMKLTDAGAAAVSSRRLRFLSPVWELDADGRPARLRSVALTNKPNIPVACVLNRAPTPANGTVEGNERKRMDKIKQLLGLPPEAGDEDAAAAVKALQEQVAKANREREEAEAESFAEEHKAAFNKDALKKAYLLNKEAATLPPAVAEIRRKRREDAAATNEVTVIFSPAKAAGEAKGGETKK